MTTWHRPCDTASCLEVREDGDQVHVRQSDRPDVVVTFTRAEWDAFTAGLVRDEKHARRLNEAVLCARLAEVEGERDDLRDALADALKDDAIEQGYASGWEDARRVIENNVETAETEAWPVDLLELLRELVSELGGDPDGEGEGGGPNAVGRWLELVWKQAIADRDAVWFAFDALGVDPRHPDAGVARLNANREALAAELATLRQHLDDAKAACAGHVSATLLDGMVSVDDLDATLEQHRHACQTIAAMQPVVDAARGWSLGSVSQSALAEAVSAYLFVQKAPETALSATLATQEVEEAMSRLRERREAQGGSQGPLPEGYRDACGPGCDFFPEADDPLTPPDGKVVYHRTSGAKDAYLQQAHPEEVAGLEEAVEAAQRVDQADVYGEVAADQGGRIAMAVRAAAPILVRAALLEAAEEVEQSGSRFEVEDPAGLLAEWLRDRADRQVGSNG